MRPRRSGFSGRWRWVDRRWWSVQSLPDQKRQYYRTSRQFSSHLTRLHSTRVRAVRVEQTVLGWLQNADSAGLGEYAGLWTRSTGGMPHTIAEQRGGRRGSSSLAITVGTNHGERHFAPGVASRPVSYAHLRREYIKRVSVGEKKNTHNIVCVFSI